MDEAPSELVVRHLKATGTVEVTDQSQTLWARSLDAWFTTPAEAEGDEEEGAARSDIERGCTLLTIGVDSMLLGSAAEQILSDVTA